MNTPILFVLTVLIWGTTWIAIAAQVGDVPIMVSIFYRFALAGVLMLLGLAVLGRLRRPAVWRFVLVQALCLFCLNFVGLYNATSLVPSGLVSVIFSLASIFNAVNARIFFGDRISRQTVLAGALGVAGLVCLFWPDIDLEAGAPTLRGIAWAVIGTMFFSWGNMASRQNAQLGVTPVTANAWGMGIGAICLLVLITITQQTLILPHGGIYWTALIYLAVAGSIVGFTTYLMLVGRIGSAKAGYATVLFPIVALTASTLFEGYEWSLMSILGVVLAALGNIVMFRKR